MSRKVDARTHHSPASAPGLVGQAIAAAGSQREVAERAGVTPRYLRMITKGEREMSYSLQVTLEIIANGS